MASSSWERWKNAGYKELDLEFLRFVARFAGTRIKWDICLLFARNPSTVDTAEHIAGLLGRQPSAVKRELDDLVLRGFLEKGSAGGQPVYALRRTAEHLRVLHALSETAAGAPASPFRQT